MAKSSRISTGALARGCARHPWLTIEAWLLLAAASLAAILLLLPSALTTEYQFTRTPESEQGMQLLGERLRGPEKVREVIIVSSESATVDDPLFRQQVESLAAGLAGLGPEVVESGFHYYLSGEASLVSPDRHTTIMPLVMAGSLGKAEKHVAQLRSLLAEQQSAGFTVLAAGTASNAFDFNSIAAQDLQQAEFFGIPIALVVLVLVFGTLVAAALPLLLAVFAIIAALGITALVGQQYQLSFFVVNMITMMGLAVGIDYSLFVLSRYREELLAGRDKLTALAKAGDTASRSVLFSGATVILALAGLLIVPSSIFVSLAAGAIFVVAVAVLAALTLLPALLSLLGGRVNSLKIPWVYRHQTAKAPAQRGGFWDRISRTVMGRPLLSAALAAVILILPGLFYFQIHTGAGGVEVLPDSFQSKQGFQILERDFSFGLIAPIEVVVDGEVSSEPAQAAIQRLQEAVKSDPAFYGEARIEVNPSGDLALISLPVSGSPDSKAATGAVRQLRQKYVPQAFAGVEGVRVLVSGAPALNLDYFDITDSFRPIVFAFVLGLSFLLLMLVFRSLVVPLKAIIMNLLSVGAAYGLIVLIFQKGVGASLLGFQQVAAVEAWVPLFLFSVLFGLSMDYHVFLLGRIRERYNQSGDNAESVAFGLRSTGSIITGAALIMVIVFGGFASGQMVMFQQMGFGLAIAVLLDATLVRSVLVPATMKLLGNRNWYLPRWLDWLPDFYLEGEGEYDQKK